MTTKVNLKILRGINKHPKTQLFAVILKYPEVVEYKKMGLVYSTPPTATEPSYIRLTKAGDDLL